MKWCSSAVIFTFKFVNCIWKNISNLIFPEKIFKNHMFYKINWLKNKTSKIIDWFFHYSDKWTNSSFIYLKQIFLISTFQKIYLGFTLHDPNYIHPSFLFNYQLFLFRSFFGYYLSILNSIIPLEKTKMKFLNILSNAEPLITTFHMLMI